MKFSSRSKNHLPPVKKTLASLIACSGIFLLSGCGDLKLGAGLNGGGEKETIMALDGVKYIAADIPDGRNKETYEQRNYTIRPDGRLLMRFESLNGVAKQIQATKPVQVRVFLADAASAEEAREHLAICPIVRNWHMLASWNSAHPWKGGAWTPGGDIELDDCVSADPPTATSLCADSGTLCFTVNSWFNNFVLQKNINYGVVLLTRGDVGIRIHGDSSGSKAPRIYWVE